MKKDLRVNKVHRVTRDRSVKKEEKDSQEMTGNADLRDPRELKVRLDRTELQDKTESPGNVEILSMAKMESKVNN